MHNTCRSASIASSQPILYRKRRCRDRAIALASGRLGNARDVETTLRDVDSGGVRFESRGIAIYPRGTF